MAKSGRDPKTIKSITIFNWLPPGVLWQAVSVLFIPFLSRGHKRL